MSPQRAYLRLPQGHGETGPTREKEADMATGSKNDIPVALQLGTFEKRRADWGGTDVSFESVADDMDCRGIFGGLPDNRCPCPHWGFLFKGRITVHYADRVEVIEPGQAYYMEPGHEPVYAAGTEVVEFSPTDKLNEVIAQVLKNVGAEQPA
jgi:hypothetical protein